MNLDFSGKAVVITGGAKGIGEATARKFSECGAAVTILDSDIETGKSAAIEIAQEGSLRLPSLPRECSRRSRLRHQRCDSEEWSHRRAGEQRGHPGLWRRGLHDRRGVDKLIDINLKGAFLVY